MGNRIMVALILVPLTLAIFLHGDKTFMIFVSLLIGIGLHELYTMMENKGVEVNKNAGILLGMAIPAALYSSITSHDWGKVVGHNVDMRESTMILVISFFFLVGIRIYKNKIEGSASYIGHTMLGIFYVGFLFSHIVPIKYMAHGSYWIITIQVLVWTADTFAYLTGMKFGKKYFSRGLCEVSPNKSIEGFIGSIVFTILVMFLLKAYVFTTLNIHGIHMIIVPLLIAVVGQIGDLCESIFKREFGVKDSGKILGGHGGILDRFDSLIWVFPLMFYYIKFFL
jgi:phosphatidate cytidylyltransferase